MSGGKKLPKGCGYVGREFGAAYVDSECFGGQLYDMDNCDENGYLYEPLEYKPCPKCKHDEWLEDLLETCREEGALASSPDGSERIVPYDKKRLRYPDDFEVMSGAWLRGYDEIEEEEHGETEEANGFGAKISEDRLLRDIDATEEKLREESKIINNKFAHTQAARMGVVYSRGNGEWYRSDDAEYDNLLMEGCYYVLRLRAKIYVCQWRGSAGGNHLEVSWYGNDGSQFPQLECTDNTMEVYIPDKFNKKKGNEKINSHCRMGAFSNNPEKQEQSENDDKLPGIVYKLDGEKI